MRPKKLQKSVTSCCPGGDCTPPNGVSRRQFLKISGLWSAAAATGGVALSSKLANCGQITKGPAHLIPADKNLPAWWLRSLFDKGARLPWSGNELPTIGMPVGGIGTGQLFLCGDGTLGQWEIFNEFEIMPNSTFYKRRTIKKAVTQGFALYWKDESGLSATTLDSEGFEGIEFRGEYPIGTITYKDGKVPAVVTMQAFSPFIPLNASDSALPATFFVITVENKSDSPLSAGVAGWLENPIARKAAERAWQGVRKASIERANEGSRIAHSAASKPKEKAAGRAPEILADFDGSSFNEWIIDGAAMGTVPSSGTLPKQNPVAGFVGAGLVNSFHGGDDPHGVLRSPEFTISRKFINFLIGGGNKPDNAGMRLLVDGQQRRIATGFESEHLRWRNWDVAEYEGRKARIEIFDRVSGPWGHVLADQIEMSDDPRLDEDFEKFEMYPDYGTMALCGDFAALSSVDAEKILAALPEDLRASLSVADTQESPLSERTITAMASPTATIAPGEKKDFVFLLTWHFPNSVKPDRVCGHEYAARFADASAVADYALKNRDRLIADTRKWRDTWYDSTLPVWMLDRLHIPVSCLSTGTVQWWKSGRFWAWEGVECCEGTCTHVWNYSQALAWLFPELERNVREQQDLKAGVGLEPNGLVGFRHNGHYAADGQCGTILKAYREHLLSADDSFLKRNWEAIRKALEYSIQQDGNSDGLIENGQHNTYDISFFGPNTFVGALYLAALRAGEEMALELGHLDFAEKMRKIFESGRRLTEEKLWNGEYFIQKVDLKQHKEHQYGPGCLSDQMFGQNWAHQVGLGYLYAPDKVKSAMESVWKYNWAPDTGTYNDRFPAGRWYTDDAEAGLFNCTWPNSEHLDNGVVYRDEVWTGIEYQVASGMVYEGLLTEGLAVVRAIHDRYHPSKRNPYNEVECSDFYARAMASWGLLLGLSGYLYHGPKGALTFAPRITPEDFRCAFTVSEGWGTFSQKLEGGNGEWSLGIKHGKLRLRTLTLPTAGVAATSLKLELDGKPVSARHEIKDKMLVIEFAEELSIPEGKALTIAAS